MADKRRLAVDHIHGQVGCITYLPSSDGRSQPGLLQTSRVVAGAPHLRVLGSSAELYPPSKSAIPETSSNLWQERRTQKRWLLQSYPGAFMGNTEVPGLLEENMNRFSKVEGDSSERPLLAIGQITNVRNPTKVSGTLALATATGESGELLRLAHINEAKWQWGQHKDTTLDLSIIDPDDPDEEVIWASDGLPISQVKFAANLTRYEAVRWLLVQKQTSTTILQPTYHKVPIAQKESADLAVLQRPSRIDPNPIVSISHKLTGGNAQIDVSLNPGHRGLPPQIAIMDECGYWSIWNVVGTSYYSKNTTRVSIDRCGHILEGLLPELPPVPAHPADKYGLLFVGSVKADGFWEDASPGDDEPIITTARARHILIWDREQFEIIDMVSNIRCPRYSPFTAIKRRPEEIIDIQISPLNQDHVIMLTTRHVFWLDICASTTEGQTPKPSVILACPHPIVESKLKMTTCLVSDVHRDAIMVFVHSKHHQQLYTYWLRHTNSLPQWHRQVLTLPETSGTQSPASDILSLEIHPLKLTWSKGSAVGPGTRYYNQGVQFYQGSIHDKDLGVRYCIFASAVDRNLEIELPTHWVGRSRVDQDHKWRRKRKQFLRHMGKSFILPDAMTDSDLQSLVRPKVGQYERDNTQHQSTSMHAKPSPWKMETLFQALNDSIIEMSGQGLNDIPSAIVAAVQEMMEDGRENGRLPLVTWSEIAESLGGAAVGKADDDAQIDMLDLFLRDDGETVVAQLGRRPAEDSFGGLVSLAQLNSSLSRLWIDPIEGKLSEHDEQVRREWVAGLARDVFLATSGLAVQDVRLFGTDSNEVEDPDATRLSQMTIRSGLSSDPIIPSSPPVSAQSGSAVNSDAAIQRLQLLAPSLSLEGSHMRSAKPSSVLTYWPTERGVGTEDYVSSVAEASDRKFDTARQRLQKIEARRKSLSDKYKLPPSKRQGTVSSPSRNDRQTQRDDVVELPAQVPTPMRIMSSQQKGPESSQSYGFPGPPVTMSQPAPGAFGDRKKAKKAKRKSGFR